MDNTFELRLSNKQWQELRMLLAEVRQAVAGAEWARICAQRADARRSAAIRRTAVNNSEYAKCRLRAAIQESRRRHEVDVQMAEAKVGSALKNLAKFLKAIQ